MSHTIATSLFPPLAMPGWRWPGALGTIRGKIFAAFFGMTLIGACLGWQSVAGVRHAGSLVVETFDKSLMSIDYARAAAADFAGMQAAYARYTVTSDPAVRRDLERRIQNLAGTLHEDLGVASARSQSERAAEAAHQVAQAVDKWLAARNSSNAERWAELDGYAATADQKIDLLINYTAGDGFLYRQSALAAIAKETAISLSGTGIALVLTTLITWLLARRIEGPVSAASAAAARIADGELDTPIPVGAADELGALLSSMAIMRNNIRAMVEREVAQRRSAQSRLTDAIEGSREGVILVDPEGEIIIANSAAATLLNRIADQLRPGVPFARLVHAAVKRGIFAAGIQPRQHFSGAMPFAGEAQLADGRWLRISRSTTQDGGFVAICSEITALKNREAELEAINIRFDAALSNMSHGLCLFDAQERLQVINNQFCDLYKIPPDHAKLGMTMRELVQASLIAGNHPGRSLDEVYAKRRQLVDGRKRAVQIRDLAGGRVIVTRHEPLPGGGWVSTHEDITEQRRQEAQIAHMARHDALTNLPNRTLFNERIALALSQLGRDARFAVHCLDLDHFKNVNDTLGHAMGDKLLQAVAQRLLGALRESDTVARLGGDEFAVVQAGIERPEDAESLARRLVGRIGEVFEIDGHRLNIGTSIGIAVAPEDGASAEDLLKNADLALYRSKADGRGTFCFFEPAMDARMQARRALELDLRNALARGEFELLYQPLYDVSLCRISGFEALVRWRHPKRGIVSPAEFIPLAEEIGLIVPLGDFVLRRATAEARSWPHDIKVAVNVSPAQFKGAQLVESVARALAESGLPAERLELEITESVLLQDNAATLAVLHALRSLGVRVSMDDFGTGYSSLSYLRSFPFDKIKIDQCFIRDLPTNQDSGAIVRAITGLGRSMGMRITAEGVETESQLDQVRQEGCSEAQGYYFSRPAPAADIPTLLARWGG
ncbi:MAG: EAL domain-containing protein [Acetobacteraceae bacterium]|nr:EAL domain-containing protein [Acetobacteraceae bacterium]